MVKYITFGEYNKYYKYIILTTLFHLASDFLLKINNLFNEKIEKLRSHSIIHDFYFQIFISIISFILYKNTFQIQSSTINDEDKKSYKIIINIIIIVTFWILIEFIRDILYNLIILDDWILGILMISLVNYIIFKQNIYKHQKFAIGFNLIICTILQILNLSINNDIIDIIYLNNKWLIPLAIIIFIFLSFSYAYIIAKVKWFMEHKYISSQKLLIYYGVIGIIIYALICLLLSFIKCNELFENNVCEIVDDQDNFYIDNIFIYFQDLSNSDGETIKYEILIMFFGIAFYFIYIYYEVMIIYYLTPVHYFFYDSIYEFIIDTFLFIYFLINKEKEDISENIFEIVGDFLAIIGFLIYLEIIELNFCDLNYNLRKKIIERGIEDLNINFNDEDDNLLFDNDSSFSELGSKTKS